MKVGSVAVDRTIRSNDSGRDDADHLRSFDGVKTLNLDQSGPQLNESSVGNPISGRNSLEDVK